MDKDLKKLILIKKNVIMGKINYWIVGATHGQTDMYDEFIENGFWYMGWDHIQTEKKSVNTFFKRLGKINKNDRIAIKRLMGKSQPNIKIMAIGIVRKVVKDIVFVDWLLTGIDRDVPSKGCFGSIYGPYKNSDEWTRSIFTI